MSKWYVHLEESENNKTPLTVKVEADAATTRVSHVLQRVVDAYRKSTDLDVKAPDFALTFAGKPLDNSLDSIPPGSDIQAALLSLCEHNGCGQRYRPDANCDDACHFHAGHAIFHEGSKGWSCCGGKKFLTFEEMMAVPPCASGRHVPAEVRKIVAPPKPEATPTSVKMVGNEAGVEHYVAKGAAPPPSISTPAVPPPAPKVEVPDAPDAVIPLGAKCLHLTCNATFQGDHSRAEECRYHSGSPLFHEGSKGWTCCQKGGTLIFEDFLTAPPCATGKHKFVPEAKLEPLRRDWYQMGDFVTIAIYAKGAKPTTSASFEERRLTAKLDLPSGLREEAIELAGAIDPAASSCKVASTKVELRLKKRDRGDWKTLEKQ